MYVIVNWKYIFFKLYKCLILYIIFVKIVRTTFTKFLSFHLSRI